MSLVEALQLTIVSIVMVFIVLSGLMVILFNFKYVFSVPKNLEEKSNQKIMENPVIEDDEESKSIAIITALVAINKEQNNKKYEVTSVKRIR